MGSALGRVTGATGWARSISQQRKLEEILPKPEEPKLAWFVREPFPSRSSQVSLVYGDIVPGSPLKVRSRMPDNGVIFSDGLESDYLAFTAGMEAVVSVSAKKGQLVH